jgi:hypothetical protein
MSKNIQEGSDEKAIEAARDIREILIDLHRRAESEHLGMVAHLLQLSIIEATHIVGDNVFDFPSRT